MLQNTGEIVYLTVSELLARALRLPALPRPLQPVPVGSVCALGNCGQPITAGYRRCDVTTEATGEFLDCFRGNVHGYVCETCARVFKGNNPHGGNQMARAHWAWEDGAYWAPMISRESALVQERPCWSDLVRAVWPERRGQRSVIILTTDTKKRLWPGARVGALGSRTPVMFYDAKSAAAGTVAVDWVQLLDCLDVIEAAYALGWVKEYIRLNLYGQGRIVDVAGHADTRRLERALAGLRVLTEFPVALLIAQRPVGWKAPEVAPRAPVPALQPALF